MQARDGARGRRRRLRARLRRWTPNTPHFATLRLCAGGALAPRRRLLERCGSAAAALSAPAGTWRECGFDKPPAAAARAIDPGDARWLEREGNHLVGWLDPDYPPLLREIPSPPLALFVSGEPARLWHPAIAIVGSRGPSAGGLRHARDFAADLARSGVCVASGLATGIDTAAHEAALEAGGLTLAVLGAGHDQPYPPSQGPAAGAHRGDGRRDQRIPARHAAAPHPVPRAQPHPRRAGAGHAGGRGRTEIRRADHRAPAAACGREVFALPGSIDNPLARGCHQLIRDGAQLAESPDDILSALPPLATGLGMALDAGWPTPRRPGRATTRPPRIPNRPRATPMACGRPWATTQRIWMNSSHVPD